MGSQLLLLRRIDLLVESLTDVDYQVSLWKLVLNVLGLVGPKDVDSEDGLKR